MHWLSQSDYGIFISILGEFFKCLIHYTSVFQKQSFNMVVTGITFHNSLTFPMKEIRFPWPNKMMQNVRSGRSFWPQLTATCFPQIFLFNKEKCCYDHGDSEFLAAVNGIKSALLTDMYFNFPWLFFKIYINFPWLKTKFPDFSPTLKIFFSLTSGGEIFRHCLPSLCTKTSS